MPGNSRSAPFVSSLLCSHRASLHVYIHNIDQWSISRYLQYWEPTSWNHIHVVSSWFFSSWTKICYYTFKINLVVFFVTYDFFLTKSTICWRLTPKVMSNALDSFRTGLCVVLKGLWRIRRMDAPVLCVVILE
jgi:hypothetical protein